MYSYIQWLYVSNIKNLCQEALLIALCILGAAAFDVDESNGMTATGRFVEAIAGLSSVPPARVEKGNSGGGIFHTNAAKAFHKCLARRHLSNYDVSGGGWVQQILHRTGHRSEGMMTA